MGRRPGGEVAVNEPSEASARHTRTDKDGGDEPGNEETDAAPGEPSEPEPELTVAVALFGFTRGAAFACRQQDRRGTLLHGFAADMTILDVDLPAATPEQIAGARTLMTVINGSIQYAQ